MVLADIGSMRAMTAVLHQWLAVCCLYETMECRLGQGSANLHRFLGIAPNKQMEHFGVKLSKNATSPSPGHGLGGDLVSTDIWYCIWY